MTMMMMTPVVPALECNGGQGVSANVKQGETSSFARHFEEKMIQEGREKKNLLGVQDNSALQAVEKKGTDRSKQEKEETGQTGLAGILAEFMEDLRKVAMEKESGPGEWNVGAGKSLLAEISEAAGMDLLEFAPLMEQMNSNGGSFELSDFLNILSGHFNDLGQQQKITAPETDIPLLGVFLSQFGLSQEQITEITEPSVQGDGTFDLEIFLAGLQASNSVGNGTAIEEGKSQLVALTDWEAEQFQNLLEKVGVTRGTQFDLLPERIFQDKPVQMSLERLQHILQGGIQDIRAQESQVNVPEFLTGLKELLTQADFETTDVGWTPVVQGSVNTIFQKLQEMVDLSHIHVTEDLPIEVENLAQETMEQIESLTDWEAEQLQNLLQKAEITKTVQFDLQPERVVQEKPVLLSLERLQQILQGGNPDFSVQEEVQVDLPEFLTSLKDILTQANFGSKDVGWTPVVQESLNPILQKLQKIVDLSQVQLNENLPLDAENFEQAMEQVESFMEIFRGQENGAEVMEATMVDDQPLAQVFPQATSSVESLLFESPKMASQAAVDGSQIFVQDSGRAAENQTVQQRIHVFEQISAGIIRGIGNQDHHLAIKLYPAELGEVKVDLLVRNEQISITFNMENAKVKELLESHMQDFKENMEQKGFVVGECSVSVGQHDDPKEAWQRFEQAWNELGGAGDIRKRPEEIGSYPDLPELRMADHDGISLMV